jgi:hypothetical protein
MNAETFAAALASARTLAQVDDLAKILWTAYGNGALTDIEAENLAGLVEARRREIRPQDRTAVRAPHVPKTPTSFFPAKRHYPVSPDKHASRERRRRLAASGPMPPALACHFTTGQLAVLRIVADEVKDKGACTLPLASIAARAGVCVTLARDAIRLAAGDGILVIEERRQHRAPNKPNLIRIVSREWRCWIDRGRRGGSKFLESTGRKTFPTPENLAPACEKDNRQASDPRFRATGGDRGVVKAVGNRGG